MRLHQPTDFTPVRASAAQPHSAAIDSRRSDEQAADRAPDRLPGDLPVPAGDPGAVEYESWLRLLRHAGSSPRPRNLLHKDTLMSNDAPLSLYDRLGRHEGIARITRTLISNHTANPLVNARYAASDMQKVEQRVVEFFCAGAGGPETYTGRDMLATHKGMNINEQEFVAVVDDAMAALESNGVDLATRNEVLAILWSLKGQVIRV